MIKIKPWQVWWVDFDPTQGHEQAKRRPALVVSSALHLRLTGGKLVNVLPLTSVSRPGWLHHISIQIPGQARISYAMTEQVRTVAVSRFTGSVSSSPIPKADIDAVRTGLRKMVDL